MKRLVRKLAGFVIMGPFILSIRIISFFTTREKAIAIVTPFIIRVAKLIAGFIVPKIKDASEFNKLTNTIINRLGIWRPLFDFTITEKNENLLKLNFTNCPFVEISTSLGYPELGPYICQGDWEFAKDNSDKFIFERTHQIGSGDIFCDHTYKRKND